jgi:hypothetical protein
MLEPTVSDHPQMPLPINCIQPGKPWKQQWQGLQHSSIPHICSPGMTYYASSLHICSAHSTMPGMVLLNTHPLFHSTLEHIQVGKYVRPMY